MKIRSGFVSNSSSSSFVVIGYRNKEYKDDFYEEDFKNKRIRNIDSDSNAYAYITGIVIADDEEIEHTTTNIGDLSNLASMVADELEVDLEEIELITGTRYC